ncbi:MAG TPA: DUF998 domain-containing protein [Pseudonocardia sp.]|nr:DUF998 domain-containing protein [Pseudonocardia sp.]
MIWKRRTDRLDLPRYAAVCWALAANFFVMQAITQAAWRTPYSLFRNPISDLGARHCGVSKLSGYVCSPWHPAMNVSFLLTGALIAVGAAWLARRDPASAAFIGLGALGWIIVGSFPSDVALPIHNTGAFLTFIPGNLGMLLYARHQRHAALTALSALGLLGAVVLIGVLPLLGPTGTAINGAVERVTAWPFPLAAAIYGALHLRGARDRRRLPRLPELT